jgi:hypothetical protein
MKTTNAKAALLLEALKSMPQTKSSQQLKRGLRNILCDCSECGCTGSSAIAAAERYIAAHKIRG